MSDLTLSYLHTLFEYKDGVLYRKIARANTKVGDEAGWIGNKGYKLVGLNYKCILEHRIIFMMFHGYMPKFVDHINGNIKDNRIENLREANCITNGYNQKLTKRNTSGCKNVSWNKQRGKWVVRIVHSKKKVKQWYVDDFELAELIAYEARIKFHGDFANHG